ncbi:response regulator [Shimia sp. SDUM112013]|uniref:response regulator n=1 Tax=Shimia sp. SDUM112013 TaxID=3136160 RepID=UPI0032EC2876
MSSNAQPDYLSVKVAQLLPYLRRYARALTGSQNTGDTYAAATIEALIADQSVFEMGFSDKVALFRAFHAVWTSAGAPVQEEGELGADAQAQKRLGKLTANSREALLLHTIEEFPVFEVAQVMAIDQREAQALIETARREMAHSLSGRVLIIEDESIIAMDLEDIVSEMGHAITGVARTHKGAVQLFAREKPDLVLSDIQLADGSSGIDAVNDILKDAGDMPVVFITAFPERLLTGERPEPAFVITKPYSEDQVRSAVSQAMFFSSTETLSA